MSKTPVRCGFTCLAVLLGALVYGRVCAPVDAVSYVFCQDRPPSATTELGYGVPVIALTTNTSPNDVITAMFNEPVLLRDERYCVPVRGFSDNPAEGCTVVKEIETILIDGMQLLRVPGQPETADTRPDGADDKDCPCCRPNSTVSGPPVTVQSLDRLLRGESDCRVCGAFWGVARSVLEFLLIWYQTEQLPSPIVLPDESEIPPHRTALRPRLHVDTMECRPADRPVGSESVPY